MREHSRLTRPAHPTSRIAACLLLLLQLSPVVEPAGARPFHPGKWTGVQPWPATAVNLVLLPGTNSAYHSRVLFWDHDNDSPILGGLWGWSPAADTTAERLINQGTYPQAGFVDLDLEDPPVGPNNTPTNIFCAGQTMLADGRLLVTGGDNLFEIGIKSALFFDPAHDENGQWSFADSMQHRRWYPDNCLLPDGRVVTVSGSSYSHYAVLGGVCDASPIDTTTRLLQRYGVATASEWGPTSVPRGTASPSLPLNPVSDAGVALGNSSLILVGGRNASGQPVGDVIRVARDRNVWGSDYTFPWTTLTNHPSSLNSPPGPRAGAAVVAFGDSGDFIAVGGVTLTGVANDSYRGRVSGDQIIWRKLAPTGDALPALHGHSAVYHPGFHRVFVFGGSNNLSETPTESEVYSLELGASQNSDVLVVTKATRSGPGIAGPRSYGSLTFDRYGRKGMPGETTLQLNRAILFGGLSTDGQPTDSLQALWFKSPTEVVWEAITPDPGPRPSARAHHAASMDKYSQWMVVSGGDIGSDESSNEAWAFDLACGSQGQCATSASNHWDQLPSLPFPVRRHVAVTLEPEPAFPRQPEIFDPLQGSLGQWDTLSLSPHWQEWYSFGFAAPRRPTDPAGADSMRVFYAGPEYVSPTLNLSRPSNRWTRMTSGTADFLAGSAVMYRPGKVMKCGTRDTGRSDSAGVVGRTAVINLKDSSPVWTEAGSAEQMISRRNHNLVVLPTGEVIVLGGARYGDNTLSTNDNCVRMPQIWNPDTLTAGFWYGQEPGGVRFDSSTARRHYHSTAVLLPDGRILCAGGNNDTLQYRADIYSPYYLFSDADGSPRARPVIVEAPSRVSYREGFTLRMGPSDSQIAKVSLVRPGATTHGFDQNQRYVPLTFSAMNQQVPGERRYRVTAPADSFDAPPGDYMLFALDGNGTPAVARWINLRSTNLDATAPTAISDLVKICSHGTWAELRWSTPQGDQGAGVNTPIQNYKISVSASAMPTLQSVLSAPTPAYTPSPPLDADVSGTASIGVYNLTEGNLYHFRIAAKDFQSGSGNWSLGNEIVFTAIDEQCGGSGGGGGGGVLEDPLTAGTSLTVGLDGPTGTGGTDREFLENTLFANVPPAVAVSDLLRLPHGPRWTGTSARVRLSHAGLGATRFTGARLRGVALAPGQSAFAFGGDLAVGTLTAPRRLGHKDGRDLTSGLAAQKAFEGHPGDTLLVEFEDGTPGRLAIAASGVQQVAPPSKTGIEVQCETGRGWGTVAHVDPRALAASTLVGVPSAGRVRLVFLGDHQLHGVSRFEPAATSASVAFDPTQVTHSRLGELGGGLGEEGALLAGGEHALVDFEVPSEQAFAFDWFLEVQGEHVAPSGSNLTAGRDDAEEAPPLQFMLHQNRPNPFAEETRIGFDLPMRSRVKLEVFDLAGRRVATLAEGEYEPGRHSVMWDRRGASGRVPAGVYTCRYTAGGQELRRQMVVF